MGVRAKNNKDYISFLLKIEVGSHTDKDGLERPIEIDLRFIDSFKFMSSSLDSLVNNLARGGHEFFSFNGYSEHQHQLLVRKGIYPYEYMDSLERFDETSLPPASSFYSKLNMSRVSDEDYEHARNIWREFATWDPYMGSNYKPREPTRYLQYLDANNLYGWAMLQPLPTRGFRWADVHPDEINELSHLEDRGYLLEVDVAYPRKLHNNHNELPFMCCWMKISGVEKLVPNLYYKKRYIIHIRALAQALDHGLVLKKIHRAIEFKQSAWM